MKLLFDENLSPSLVRALSNEFPGSLHVHHAGLTSKGDASIWDYAKSGGFSIVSKDADFHHRSFLEGHPPKVIGIALGNCAAAHVAVLLQRELELIRRFLEDPETSFLLIEDREQKTDS